MAAPASGYWIKPLDIVMSFKHGSRVFAGTSGNLDALYGSTNFATSHSPTSAVSTLLAGSTDKVFVFSAIGEGDGAIDSSSVVGATALNLKARTGDMNQGPLTTATVHAGGGGTGYAVNDTGTVAGGSGGTGDGALTLDTVALLGNGTGTVNITYQVLAL